MGNINDGEPVLARIHSQCLTGDTLGSLKCDCGQQLDFALKNIAIKRNDFPTVKTFFLVRG